MVIPHAPQTCASTSSATLAYSVAVAFALRRVLLYTIFFQMSILFLKFFKIFSRNKIFFLDKKKKLIYNVLVVIPLAPSEKYFSLFHTHEMWRSWGEMVHAAYGGCSNPFRVAATWRLTSEPRERRQSLSCNRTRKRTTACFYNFI